MRQIHASFTTNKRIPLFFALLVIICCHSTVSYNHPKKISQTKKQPTSSLPRRKLFEKILSTTTISAAATLSLSLQSPPSPAAAAFFEQSNDRRQLELCIVNVIRLQYWAQSIVYILETSESLEARKQAYLEARLGGKAIVAEKKNVGGGGSLRVLTIKGLQLKECLKDLKYYAKTIQKNKQMDRDYDDLIESLASLVEFDGLESTQDPSPRSSLTLGMYNLDKEVYVRRMLSERIIGLTKDIVEIFGPEKQKLCEQYVAEFYPSELPPKRQVAPTEAVKDEIMASS